MQSSTRWQPLPSKKEQIDFPIDFKKKDSVPENETKVNKISEYKKAAEKMREDVNTLKSYFMKYGDDGDNQFAFKLALEFFKSQAITKNLQEETRTIKLNLHRAMRPLDEIKWKEIPEDHKQHNQKQQQNQQATTPNIFPANPSINKHKDSQDDEDSESGVSDDILENSKMIEELLLRKKTKKKAQNTTSTNTATSTTNKKTPKSNNIPNYMRSFNPTQEEEYSDNQVYFDSEESDQSMLSLEQSSGEEVEQSENSQQEDDDDSQEDENLRQYYFQQDYEDGLIDQEDFQAKDLLKLFSSSRHKKQQSLNRMQYSEMSKQEKQKYFKKLNTDFNKRLKRDTRPTIGSGHKKSKRVSFDSSVRVKVFNKDSKAADVFFTNEKEQVLVRQIWEYDEQ